MIVTTLSPGELPNLAADLGTPTYKACKVYGPSSMLYLEFLRLFCKSLNSFFGISNTKGFKYFVNRKNEKKNSNNFTFLRGKNEERF